jgi:hypothetical protein
MEWTEYLIVGRKPIAKLLIWLSETVFRIAEMTLVVGAVAYVEQRAHQPAIASTVLSFLEALYIDGQLTASMLQIFEENKAKGRWRIIFALAFVLAGISFSVLLLFTQTAIPLMVANH